jgi:phage terminase small subunit
MGARADNVAALTKDWTFASLSERERLFVDGVMRGMTQTAAARAAGYSDAKHEGSRLMRSPKIIKLVQELHAKYAEAAQVSRKQVLDGMLDAIQMAKMQGDTAVMVAGWREIGKMCGFYAAEKKEVSVNITAKRAIDKLETMTDQELLEMMEKDSAALEGEFTEVAEPEKSGD